MGSNIRSILDMLPVVTLPILQNHHEANIGCLLGRNIDPVFLPNVDPKTLDIGQVLISSEVLLHVGDMLA